MGAILQRLREWLADALASAFTTTIVTATSTPLSFNIQPNEVWFVDCQLTAQCSGTGGLKYAVAAPAGASIEGWIFTSAAAITTLRYLRLTAINTLMATAGHVVAATPGGDIIRFTITNGATAGAVAIQVASGTAGQTSTIFAGASLAAYRAA
jgi:hypothetical protein